MAMTVAEKPCPWGQRSCPQRPGSQDIRTWVRQGLWADILDLDIDEVRERASRPPAWTAGEKGYYGHDREHFPEQRRQPQREAAAERDDPEAGG